MAVKLKLLATYYRALVDGEHRTIYQGETFETDEANAARLVTAGAAEEATGPEAGEGPDGGEKEDAPPPVTDPAKETGTPTPAPVVDPPEKPKPTARGAK